MRAASTSLDRFALLRGDTRMRPGPGGKSTVATVAKAEPLRPPPATAYPVLVSDTRLVSRQALVSYRGNRYSVPPELVGDRVTVTRPVGGEVIDISTDSGIVIARHRLAADGTGAMVRDHGHVIALNETAMNLANSGKPHRRKERIPPGEAARAAASALLHNTIPAPDTAAAVPDTTVIDLAAYERAATGRNTLTWAAP
jgi:hypothetical protein